MRIAEAVAALGVEARDGEDLCLVQFVAGDARNATLAECGDLEINGDLYLASGTFRAGTIRRTEGRRGENVARILWLPFDLDLTDYLDYPTEPEERAAAIAILHAMADDELMALIDRQRADAEELFATVGLAIHRLDYTGYGLCAYAYVHEDDQSRVADLRIAHKALVERLNAVAGYRLCDPQVSDAGTRITRLPMSDNTKGAVPRRSRTLARTEGSVRLESVPASTPTPPRVVIPEHGKGLSEEALGAIVEAVRPSWATGYRHAVALGLAGMFAKAGIPEAQAQSVVRCLSDGDEEARDRLRAVATSYARVRSGLLAGGFTRLRELLPAEALAFVDRELQAVAKATTGNIRVGGRPLEAAAVGPIETNVPFSCTEPPAAAFSGWIGRYHEVVEPTTEAADAFHLATGLVLAGATIGRRVHTAPATDEIYANIYALLIGPSGSSRKDTAIKRALALPNLVAVDGTRIRHDFYVARDVASAEGLIAILKDFPNTLVYLSEFSSLLANARRKGTRTILDRLIEAWDTPGILQNLNKNTPIHAVDPYLSIVAATQPGRLATEMTDEDIHSGFANRWLYVPGIGKARRPRPPKLDRAMAMQRYRELLDALAEYSDGQEIPWSRECDTRWDTWYLTRTDGGLSEDEETMSVRHANLAQKLALIYAASSGAKAIGPEHLEAAIAVVNWSWENVRALLKAWGVGRDSQLELRIKDVLSRHGAMKRWQVQARCSSRKWSAKDFAVVFDAMLKNGTIEVDVGGLVALGERA